MIPGIVAQVGAGESAPVAGHRYWRVFVVDSDDASWTSLSRLEMYSSQLYGAGRTDCCVGGTPIYSSQGGFNNAEVASNAFDDLNNTVWTTRPSGSARLNSYIGYDFGAPIAIDRFALQTRGESTTQMPRNFRLEYSDDGSIWTTLYTPAAQTGWTANEMRLFTTPDYAPPAYTGSPQGAHRYWRIHCARSSDGGSTYSAGEVEMRATPGGADQCNGGTATAHSNFSGSFNAPKAFDNNPATLWSANGAAGDGWLKYDFGSPVEVAEVMIQARNDASFGQTPRWGQIEFSDDNAHWSVAWEYEMPSTYSAGLVQVTTDPAYV